MIKAKNIFYLFFFLLLLSYISVLFVFARYYSEKRWIPKVVLTLPVFEKKQTSSADMIKPDVLPVEKNDFSFNILFDTVPLDAVDMLRSWDEEKNALETYSKKTAISELPKVSIILTDVGLNDELFWNAIYKLPTSITLSFSPYSSHLEDKINAVRQNGFENMMDIVVQDEKAYHNAGVLGIKQTDSAQEIQQLIQKNYLDEGVPFIGFWLNRAVQENSEFKIVADAFWNKYGLFTLNNQDVFRVVENDFFENALVSLLKEAQTNAKKNGKSIIVMPMHPLVVDLLIRWSSMQFNAGIDFVPLSVIVK